MVVKSATEAIHLEDLQESFRSVRKHNLKLNPEKCSFGIQSGKFLGYMLTERGIEANPDKCRAIMEMQSPSNVKEVQRLTGRIVALQQFLSCSADRLNRSSIAQRRMTSSSGLKNARRPSQNSKNS